ncbi:MAG: zinc dependent phospholipase C family protein [Bacilli bacterium]|nr:zinc dependent phospholipase C family protein [Bacilli bacterium]
MPATVCHAYFCMEVYKKIKDFHRTIDSCDLVKFRMFGQNTDPFMFYNIENFKRGKNIRDFQYYFHTHKSQDFFLYMCHYIKDNQLYNCSEVLSFLYGFVCHYVLDSIVHPFVIYKTGEMDKNDINSYKYNCGHAYMETYLDNIIIKEKMHNTQPFHFRTDKYCFDLSPFSTSLDEVIDHSFSAVFSIDDMSTIYYQSLRQMKSFLFKYRYDSLGIKKFCYKIIDLFTSRSTFKFSCLSYHYMPDNTNYLNLLHQTWYNPIDLSIQSTKSFFDLYNDALEEAVSIIYKVNLFFDSEDILLDTVFSNKSYLTGLDCSKKIKYKKFEF